MNFLITALALYGLSALISQYDGPWSVFARLRNKYPNSPLTCTVCLSVWLAIPIILLAVFVGTWSIVMFALVGIVIILENLR